MHFKQNLVDRALCLSRDIQAKLHLLWRCYTLPTVKQRPRPLIHQIESLEDRTLLTAAFPEFIDPNPSADNGFGDTVVVLSTGNVVITSPYDDAGGTDAGAVYLFDGETKELISTLRGSSNYDRVGYSSVTVLPNGNYLVSSSDWNKGAGAVTFGNGITGVSGIVSVANSLIGTTQTDSVGGTGVTVLSNGNYVVSSGYWDNNGLSNVGAVTFGDGDTGVTGVVSAANSLVGSMSYDALGSDGVTALSNGNFVVRSSYWDNGSVENAGAVTFGDGNTGVTGVVSVANSLVGATSFDHVGRDDLTELSNGNFLVTSLSWDNGAAADAGAVTFGEGTTGVTGVVSAANSLIGEFADDKVGSEGVTLLPNGNYLVGSVEWNRSRGAVTFGDGMTGVNGVVSEANSLVGSFTGDKVGRYYGITILTNGNYVVSSGYWHDSRGAVTFGDGTTGVTGVVSAANSLIGESVDDRVSNGGVTALSNGNYVVTSSWWNNGPVDHVGAVTFGNGTTGVKGTISKTNSLVGSTEDDHVGNGGITALSNGNYVVSSSTWDNGSIINAGAVTFGNGTTGVTGFISETNSLVGSSISDLVGADGVTALTNGNYVVSSGLWDNGEATAAGAVTFGNGITGVSGVVSAANSLVGSSKLDFVGRGDFHVAEGGGPSVLALPNGNYLVRSGCWNNGMAEEAGAVTFGNGTTGVSGVVSAANSLVGTTSFDHVGFRSSVTVFSNSNYVVSSANWDNNMVEDTGAVSFGDGNTGVSGIVSAANSLIGSTSFDHVGSDGVTELSNGNYVVRSSYWDNALVEDAGAVTFGDGTTGVTGVVSADNSFVGSTRFDKIGSNGLIELSNGNFLVRSYYWDNDGMINAGAVTFGDGSTGVSGIISTSNSIVGFEPSSYYLTAKLMQTILDDLNNTYYVTMKDEGRVWVGSQVDGFPPRILDEISDVIISENSTEQTVSLTGITAGSRSGNQLRVTATSSNPDLIPDPAVSYISLDTTGSLTFTPAENQTGTATITVTIEDGGLDGILDTTEDNFMSQRTFDVLVTIPVDIDLRVVSSPASVGPDGQTSILPAHQDRVDEWSSFWLEIWVSTTNIESPGIFSASLYLDYQTEYVSPTVIEYGPGFSLNQTGTINDSNGVIENLSAETNQTGLGISDFLLFARIKFESLAEDGVHLDLLNQLIGPYDLGFSVSTPQVSDVTGNPVSTNINSFPGTSIWANPFDLNDDDKINYRDLILLVGVYGTIPSESDSDYAWVADLDQSDRVDYRDLISFVGNYGKGKVNDPDVNYPSNYPEAWNNLLRVSSEPQRSIKTASLTQAEADQVLAQAIEQVSEQLTPEMNQSLSGVEVKVVDLSGTTVGRAVAGTIYLDVNAAGYGWFVDTTPLDSSEFAIKNQSSLIALPDSAAAGRIDLWTVILHELGHLVGYEHKSEGVMEETLAPGVRKLTEWDEDSDLFFASVQEEAELLPF